MVSVLKDRMRKARESNLNKVNKHVVVAVIFVLIAIKQLLSGINENIITDFDSDLSPNIDSSLSVNTSPDHKVDDSCLNMARIRPSGSYFLDTKVLSATSPAEKISPSFTIGTYIGPRVSYHMGGDADLFTLVKEALSNKGRDSLTFDIGANQGFYTYYMATLGMQVHSFEISEKNFKALQHGAEFNSNEIVNRVNLYPVGLGQSNARFSMKGGQYEGFLNEGSEGNILGVTFDCFAHHSKLDLSNVAFVKLDVEGFEIAVLRGATNSLFAKSSNIGGMLMEVGPSRWKRASVDLNSGIDEMKKLSTHFKESYIVVRGQKDGGNKYDKTCPVSLAEKILSDKSPRVLEINGHSMYKVRSDEWRALLVEMDDGKLDCNFFYRN